MKTVTPAISIIIPARNEGEMVKKAILSFAAGRSHKFPIEFVIVDDASADGCCHGVQYLLGAEKDAATVTVIRMQQWSGIPVSRNTGAFAARAPILFITDANVEACAGWDIPVFRDLLPERALCGVVADASSAWKGYGCALQMPAMGTQWLPAPGIFGDSVPVMPEAATVIHASLFRRLGGYDTAMPAYGACEPEFSVRLWLSGAQIAIAPGILLRHRFRPQAARQEFLKLIAPVLVQNYLRFGMLYLVGPDLARLMQHYAAHATPAHFRQALHNLEASDVYARREHLRRQLEHGFAWYKERFNYHGNYTLRGVV